MTVLQTTDRAQRLAHELPAAGVDALLVSALVNLRYITGYTGSNGLALVGPQTRVFVTDFRYVEQAEQEVDPSFDRRRGQQELLETIPEALPPGPLRLGFDDAHVTVREYAKLLELMPERVQLVEAAGLVEGLREVKEADEIEQI